MNGPYDVRAAFAVIEDELIASMMRNMSRHRTEEAFEGRQWAMWQAVQLKALEKYKRANRKKYGRRFREMNGQMEALIRRARDEGGMEQEIAMLRAIRRGHRFPHMPERVLEALEAIEGANAFQKIPKLIQAIRSGGADPLTGEFFRLNERKLEALIKATTHDMEKAETAVLRMADDQYRRAIFNAQMYANTGAGTYEKAVDMATKDMLAAGLNCVEYRNGARHTLADYADMAIRTACKRAYLQGEGAMRREWGISTVIMNKRGNPCPKCLPFCGKVLIDDVWSGGKKSDGPYPLMSAAVAAGLYHPRCKDSHTTYFPGISTADGAWTREELEAVEKASKREAKRQYAKRQAERFGRLARHSLDAENKAERQRKAEKWSLMEQQCSEESDWKTKMSSLIFGKSVDEQAKEFYHSLIYVEDDDIYGLLRQAYKRVKFRRSDGRRSFFRDKERCVYLAKNAEYSTIAHELFHEIDDLYGITENGGLETELISDHKRLQAMEKKAGKTIPEMLYSKHPEMFDESYSKLVVKRKYRGIADIINGMSDGKVKLGYRHADGYWKKDRALQKETWAQYGRMYYAEDEEVMEALKDIFPETTREFERIIKAVVK